MRTHFSLSHNSTLRTVSGEEFADYSFNTPKESGSRTDARSTDTTQVVTERERLHCFTSQYNLVQTYTNVVQNILCIPAQISAFRPSLAVARARLEGRAVSKVGISRSIADHGEIFVHG